VTVHKKRRGVEAFRDLDDRQIHAESLDNLGSWSAVGSPASISRARLRRHSARLPPSIGPKSRQQPGNPQKNRHVLRGYAPKGAPEPPLRAAEAGPINRLAIEELSE
jgi:hypothetical protein